MSLDRADKAGLRRELRARRGRLSAGEQREAALMLPRLLAGLPGWTQAEHIALYMAADGEMDTGPIAEQSREAGKKLYLPVLAPGEALAFALWEAAASLRPNRFRIPEPPPDAPRREPDRLDVIFLPLVGWDARGGRLGMGGGFYDRSLARVSGPLRVGLAHDCQEVDRLPLEPWDVPLDYVATATRLVNCRGASPAVKKDVSPE